MRGAEGSATVVVQPAGRRCVGRAGATVLEALQAAGVVVPAVCGGVGACGACAVRVVGGELTPPAGDEVERLGEPARAAGHRLACRARLTGPGDVVVELLEAPATPLSQTEARGIESLRSGASPAGGPRPARVGLAVDLGTTGLAAYLVDLSGVPPRRVLASAGSPNPQVSFGEDVMARLAVALTDPARTSAMRTVLAAEVDRLAGVLCAEAGVSRRAVREAVVVGNTAMHHLFFGLPVRSLAWAPYVPADARERTVPAQEVGLHLGPGATVTSPPVVAGFVGADHVAVLLAAGAGRVGAPPPDRVTAYLDVGTNTEVSLVARGRHLACSAASGPAFEGAHVEAGMRAAPGAIEAVRWEGGRLRVRTVDGRPALGICGSGLLDAVAELRRCGALTEVGGWAVGHPAVTGSGREAGVVLAPPPPGGSAPLRLTRRDVGELQLAKAAIRAGLRLLTEAAAVGEDDIDEIVLAGAFGTHLDVRSARRVGLVPDVPRATVRQVGNAAGAGACLLLGDEAARADAGRIAAAVEYVELTGHPHFQDRFTQALRLVADPWEG